MHPICLDVFSGRRPFWEAISKRATGARWWCQIPGEGLAVESEQLLKSHCDIIVIVCPSWPTGCWSPFFERTFRGAIWALGWGRVLAWSMDILIRSHIGSTFDPMTAFHFTNQKFVSFITMSGHRTSLQWILQSCRGPCIRWPCIRWSIRSQDASRTLVSTA